LLSFENGAVNTAPFLFALSTPIGAWWSEFDVRDPLTVHAKANVKFQAPPESISASAANLKFRSIFLHTRHRNFKFKAALES
jgi:hypothetical protein